MVKDIMNKGLDSTHVAPPRVHNIREIMPHSPSVPTEKHSLEDPPDVAVGNQIRVSQRPPQVTTANLTGPPEFHISSLWKLPVLNPVNGKARLLLSYTLPILTFNNAYSRNFHLSWLGFFVAFLSWFAFPPLIPEAIKTDLKLTTAQIGNSNIAALCATLVVRWAVGPLIDRFGPRYVMAALLVLGAIPSGLVGTVSSAGGLYTVRIFIGILGGTFVPCQAWTTAWFDKSVVGRANALVAGWGNVGGGVTFAVMVALYQRLLSDGLSPHSAWRASFAIIPVPILLIVAILTLIFGTDHPAGKWSQRHKTPATALAAIHGHEAHLDRSEAARQKGKMEKQRMTAVVETQENEEKKVLDAQVKSETDTAINETLTVKMALRILSSPLTWLPAFSYMASFGLELAVDANLTTVLFNLFHARDASFGQTKAGYYTALFGALNIFTRPMGGHLADMIYEKHGVSGKKWLMLSLSFVMGAFSIGLGQYIEKHVEDRSTPSLAVIMVLITIIAIFCEMANGANFALVPHCNAYSNGVMSGIVGGMGNLELGLMLAWTRGAGGIWFALVFRYQPTTGGKAFWIMGIICIISNLIVAWIHVPKW
ncbi:hypothetical protein EW146_g8278 [Bondarzewia mesenterica]|uniref:Major facilitator superfamily (MFS) profile domain-containing protein n=1 Tax=Bondarzewia mesenterica TaxID=1095465 RepID=A0A4S4LHH0_9AGAM|nr:hypothetical protein EW146_g8278 [Bondarzewia mesenterica]